MGGQWYWLKHEKDAGMRTLSEVFHPFINATCIPAQRLGIWTVWAIILGKK